MIYFLKVYFVLLSKHASDNQDLMIMLIVCLFVYCFMSRSRIFHLYGDVTITGEGLQNGPLSREGALSCHTCCDLGPRFSRFYPKSHPIQSPLTTHKRTWWIYSNPDPHGLCVKNLKSRELDSWILQNMTPLLSKRH
jgi:hypothetical protein